MLSSNSETKKGKMNRFLALVFVVASASAQLAPPPQNGCGCAPAPVIIQLSCGNGGQAQVPPSHPPPEQEDHHTESPAGWAGPEDGSSSYEPPAGWTESPAGWTESPAGWTQAPPPGGWNGPEDGSSAPPSEEYEHIIHMCEFDANGHPTNPSIFPNGFRIKYDAEGNPVPYAPEGFPGPSPSWDGTLESLGFPMPAENTPHWNMLMCWPMPIPVMSPGK